MAESSSVRIVPIILGPTGAGKTDLALRLAERLPVEIVSVDSAMVYRGMDIGTGKPDRAVLDRLTHHLVDILDPGEPYSAGQFVRDAYAAIDAIHARGRIPLLVGGTMLYVRALRRGIAEMPEKNADVRRVIDDEAAQHGWPALHAELQRVDPIAAARIQPRDGQRIQRALEVFRLTGSPISVLHQAARPIRTDVRFTAIAWSPQDRQRLYEAIEKRFYAMMKAGLLEEVRRLFARGDLHEQTPSMRAVGYRQLWEHLQGRTALDSAIERAIVATRHLARRQLIWMRAEDDLEWIDAYEPFAAQRVEERLTALLSM